MQKLLIFVVSIGDYNLRQRDLYNLVFFPVFVAEF